MFVIAVVDFPEFIFGQSFFEAPDRPKYSLHNITSSCRSSTVFCSHSSLFI